MNESLRQPLIEYGRLLMAKVAGGESVTMPEWTKNFLALLTAGQEHEANSIEPLQSVFSLVQLAGLHGNPKYLQPVSLSTASAPSGQWKLQPVNRTDAASVARSTLFTEFIRATSDEQSLERFGYVMRKYASTLPNTYGEPGVSLFEQWKLIAALAHIAGNIEKPPQKFGLVGGDIPGIQSFISLITSKGAAKGMRGRSVFIQLLGSALVQRIVDELGLGSANIVYDAGGNFVILTGWDESLPARIEAISNEVNRLLLQGTTTETVRFDGFHSDLAVAIAAVELPVTALQIHTSAGGHLSQWQQAEGHLKKAVAAAKQRPFADLALSSAEDWQLLFDPEVSETADFCAVCRRQRRANELFKDLDRENTEPTSIAPATQCPECAGFKDLAESLTRPESRLLIDMQMPTTVTGWQHALFVVSKKWYSISSDKRARGDVTLAMDLDHFPATDLDGFRLLARTTPVEGGAIVDNELLANKSKGMRRLGVLKMDVDKLGELFAFGLPQRTITATAELSTSMDRFFSAWLDRICKRVADTKEKFYVLYAGGDDLFAVGPWTAIVQLAQEINRDFEAYTGQNPALHLSAGISVVDGKSPLHTAGRLAEQALHDAKNKDKDQPAQAKNAISFLDEVYHWREFTEVDKLHLELFNLVEVDGLPKSLLTTLRSIEVRYHKDKNTERGQWANAKARTREGTVKVYFGPWMWRQAYALARIRDRQKDKEIQSRIQQLEDKLLDGAIQDLGLAARWAQWELREEKTNGEADKSN